MTPQTVNAYYNPTLNEIVFPAACTPPFFNLKAEDAVNYGGIETVVMKLAWFDDQGSTDGEGCYETGGHHKI
jgi:predicted metalloendopeptidase